MSLFGPFIVIFGLKRSLLEDGSEPICMSASPIVSWLSSEVSSARISLTHSEALGRLEPIVLLIVRSSNWFGILVGEDGRGDVGLSVDAAQIARNAASPSL